MVESKYVRDGFGQGLIELGQKDQAVVVLTAGVAESVRTHWFGEKHPDRYFQMGIAEQNMLGAAAGLALVGKIPFVSSFGSFMPARSFDQIRVSVCYNDAPVKIVSTHCGITTGEDGASAQMMEDIALMRALPNMTVVAPCDYTEAKQATIAAASYPHPIYIRMGRDKAPIITDDATPFVIGKAKVLKEGSDVTLFACGLMVHESLAAAESLKAEGISAEVINVHTIKPIDTHAIVKSVSKTGCCVAAEEHQLYGGLGGAIAEVLAREHPAPMAQVAMPDKFGSSGKGDELLKAYHLTAHDIVSAAKEAIKRKAHK